MLLIGLLLVALTCLILGLVLASGPWLVGSLLGSTLAAIVLWRQREGLSRSGGRHSERAAPGSSRPGAPRQTALVTGSAFAGKLGDGGAAGGQATVWVVDGQPSFHRRDCAELHGAAAEEVPYRQADADGFVACDRCRPDGGGTAGGTVDDTVDDTVNDSAGAQSPPERVWVVDGRPRYHLQGCLIIQGQAAEPVALEQATEDGFIPCSMCEPHPARV